MPAPREVIRASVHRPNVDAHSVCSTLGCSVGQTLPGTALGTTALSDNRGALAITASAIRFEGKRGSFDIPFENIARIARDRDDIVIEHDHRTTRICVETAHADRQKLASGRLNRVQFLIRLCAVNGIAIGLFFLGVYAESHGNDIYSLLLLLFALPYVLYTSSVIIRRVHDFDQGGPMCVLYVVGSLIPGPNLLVVIALLCMPGTKGRNRYGGESSADGSCEPKSNHD